MNNAYWKIGKEWTCEWNVWYCLLSWQTTDLVGHSNIFFPLQSCWLDDTKMGLVLTTLVNSARADTETLRRRHPSFALMFIIGRVAQVVNFNNTSFDRSVLMKMFDSISSAPHLTCHGRAMRVEESEAVELSAIPRIYSKIKEQSLEIVLWYKSFSPENWIKLWKFTYSFRVIGGWGMGCVSWGGELVLLYGVCSSYSLISWSGQENNMREKRSKDNRVGNAVNKKVRSSILNW